MDPIFFGVGAASLFAVAFAFMLLCRRACKRRNTEQGTSSDVELRVAMTKHNIGLSATNYEGIVRLPSSNRFALASK